MIALATLLPKKDGLLRPLTEAIREMNSAIRTYEELPTQIATREKKLANVKPNQVYNDKAKEYVRETGRDAWANFDLHTNLQALLILLATIRENHTKKTMLTEMPRQLRAFDTGFDKIEEYM